MSHCANTPKINPSHANRKRAGSTLQIPKPKHQRLAESERDKDNSSGATQSIGDDPITDDACGDEITEETVRKMAADEKEKRRETLNQNKASGRWIRRIWRGQCCNCDQFVGFSRRSDTYECGSCRHPHCGSCEFVDEPCAESGMDVPQPAAI